MVFNKNVSKSGFTLLELIIVIGMIAIASAIAIPLINSSLPDYRLRSAARDIISLMRETKLRAIKENTTAAMEFDFINNTYFAWVNNKADTTGTLAYEQSKGDTIFTQGNLPVGIDIYINGSDDIPNPFGFNNRGFPATNTGSVFMRNDNSNYRRILVNIPGNISIQRSTDGGSTWNYYN